MARSFRRQLQSSARLWREFRETPARRARAVSFDIPKTLAIMGRVRRLEYTTSHGARVVEYFHDFAPGSRPLFCAAPDGRIFLIGGRYRVTPRGIVDLQANGRVRRESRRR
jgi:hypothetical protein